MFEMIDLENLCQGHRVKNSQWCHSLAITNLYENHTTHFTLTLTDSEKFWFEMFDLKNLDQGHEVQLAQFANVNVYNSHTWIFFASSHRFIDISILNFVTLKM